ncbi:hypothetical protein [Psychrobacter phenylpyruvicus]|uniref:Uncharacterized protein n=1 Tax=Psychrobacter phenylpyruvicus TaxID=29432 RepID=A0A379LJ91_9GAMM|nr:hypothetical protein [Psychrobacter phenylpyruvicus]SUD90613.1 Uncharacterised protein [Psychrobacter phenylpyruvicus]
MDLVTYITERLISYADDIVPVNRQEIIDFFESENAPYREDHVDFLARFGGNHFTAFLKNQNANFSFQEIKELYQADKDYPDEVELAEGCCHFANPYVDNWYCIEQATGIIYREAVDEDNNPILSEVVWCNIKSLLFMSSLYYLDRVGTRLSIKDNLTDEFVQIFQDENRGYRLDMSLYGAYYIKEDMFYYLSLTRNFLTPTKLHPWFYEELKNFKASQ